MNSQQAFVVTGIPSGSAVVSSRVVCSRRAALSPVTSSFLGTPTARHVTAPATGTERKARWTMGKVAKFGPFSPIVVLTRLFIGEKNLNKLRGKAISLHSQAITNFCEYVGTGGKIRANLIKTAKENGSTLGFLS
mmetsp:Transcript_54509/g.133646  ORF Transcript_54509/g.133646 Transcript_54509/m.133646 type:complete len:135 (+) Transcript_54509:298-702(+)|eukprot:CAMPEP_0198321948 /NCGR_PEP_ID=MMETSP1450-20131203/10553_1 /TAXON_ID=753684 ORGANISM="Madagascaria erythrocladiodes, Strain CCMP3234" /NCGR_SAMPLE_ID=MMETSP1450 /ASSEMBLY_ACC=CAM_ASM_001115 /LENGTH=134 /DNA_ID=CAMNT_0044025533 /DNA_START=287 /DNA_END=691 /DNA_ORIENTATION=-